MGPLKMPRLDFAGPAWAVLPGVVGAITVALEVVGGAGGGGLLASAGPPGASRRNYCQRQRQLPPALCAAAHRAHSHEALPNKHVLTTGAERWR